MASSVTLPNFSFLTHLPLIDGMDKKWKWSAARLVEDKVRKWLSHARPRDRCTQGTYNIKSHMNETCKISASSEGHLSRTAELQCHWTIECKLFPSFSKILHCIAWSCHALEYLQNYVAFGCGHFYNQSISSIWWPCLSPIRQTKHAHYNGI